MLDSFIEKLFSKSKVIGANLNNLANNLLSFIVGFADFHTRCVKYEVQNIWLKSSTETHNHLPSYLLTKHKESRDSSQLITTSCFNLPYTAQL